MFRAKDTVQNIRPQTICTMYPGTLRENRTSTVSRSCRLSFLLAVCLNSGVTQRDIVYLHWPIAPSYMSPNAGKGGGAGFQPMSTAVKMHVAQITFGDITHIFFNLCLKFHNYLKMTLPWRESWLLLTLPLKILSFYICFHCSFKSILHGQRRFVSSQYAAARLTNFSAKKHENRNI